MTVGIASVETACRCILRSQAEAPGEDMDADEQRRALQRAERDREIRGQDLRRERCIALAHTWPADRYRRAAVFLGAWRLPGPAVERKSVAIFEEALVAARATRSPRLIGRVLGMAHLVFAESDRERVRPFLDEAAVLLGACNYRLRLASIQSIRAEMLFAEGDLAGALAATREAEAVFREDRTGMNLASTLQNAAAYLLAWRVTMKPGPLPGKARSWRCVRTLQTIR